MAAGFPTYLTTNFSTSLCNEVVPAHMIDNLVRHRLKCSMHWEQKEYYDIDSFNDHNM